VTAGLMAAGVLVVPTGTKVVRFIPPLIVTEDEVNQAMSKLDVVISNLLNK
jgi:acetylornithine aminotransferase